MHISSLRMSRCGCLPQKELRQYSEIFPGLECNDDVDFSDAASIADPPFFSGQSDDSEIEVSTENDIVEEETSDH